MGLALGDSVARFTQGQIDATQRRLLFRLITPTRVAAVGFSPSTIRLVYPSLGAFGIATPTVDTWVEIDPVRAAGWYYFVLSRSQISQPGEFSVEVAGGALFDGWAARDAVVVPAPFVAIVVPATVAPPVRQPRARRRPATRRR